MGRDYEPVPGQWYENIEEDESFRVLSVDEDSELLEIEYLDGDIEELDLDTWHEMDLEKIAGARGLVRSDDEEEEDEEGTRMKTRTRTRTTTGTMMMTRTTRTRWTTSGMGIEHTRPR